MVFVKTCSRDQMRAKKHEMLENILISVVAVPLCGRSGRLPLWTISGKINPCSVVVLVL